MTVEVVRLEDLADEVTEQQADWLADIAARSNGRHSLESIAWEHETRRVWIWLVVDADEARGLVVSEMLRYPTGVRWLNVRAGVGDMKALEESVEFFEALARNLGCEGVESTCRLGWTRKFKSRGYRHTHSFIEKAL